MVKIPSFAFPFQFPPFVRGQPVKLQFRDPKIKTKHKLDVINIKNVARFDVEGGSVFVPCSRVESKHWLQHPFKESMPRFNRAVSCR